MGQVSVPASPTYYATHYDNLKGVDFSCDLTEVDKRRTPTGVNMISDDGGNPVKRRGWRCYEDLECGKILEVIFHEDDESNYDPLKIYVIAEDGIYAVVTTNGVRSHTKILDETIESATYYLFNGEVFAFVDNGLYKLSGATAELIDDEAYVPEVVISRRPDGTDGIGLEAINLLTPMRKFSFLGNETDTTYWLYPQQNRQEPSYKCIVATDIKVEVLTVNGWVELVQGTDYSLQNVGNRQGKDEHGQLQSYTVCDPCIVFTTAHAPITVGHDNVSISFQAWNDDTDEDGNHIGLYKEERVDLLGTKACLTYGYSAVDRIFCVGSINRNRIYYSDVNEPMYYPDNNYIIVGHDTNGIVGLHRVSEYLAAVKEDSSIESTIFLINGSYLDNNMFFKVQPTSAGTGAIAPKSFSTLVDEPLFLSRNGIYAIANYYTTTEKVIRNRSYFLDKKLLKEENLENACSCVWHRYYFLAVNGHCYVLDGRKKTTDKRDNTDFLYESYYLENIPAVVFTTYKDELWFGTEDGRLCKFNTDVDNRTKFCDDGIETYNDDNVLILEGGEAIYCEWSTPLDDDGRVQYFKTLNKKGTLLTLLPYERTSAEVTLVKDGETRYELGIFYADIQTWELIDFDRFTFNSNDTAQDAFFKRKVKKYKRLQIVVKNTTIYEPFGILQLIKTYAVNNFSKNRG